MREAAPAEYQNPDLIALRAVQTRVVPHVDADDRYLGAVRVPEHLERLSVREIGSDHVWGILRDDLDVQYVVRARIVKPGL